MVEHVDQRQHLGSPRVDSVVLLMTALATLPCCQKISMMSRNGSIRRIMLRS